MINKVRSKKRIPTVIDIPDLEYNRKFYNKKGEELKEYNSSNNNNNKIEEVEDADFEKNIKR